MSSLRELLDRADTGTFTKEIGAPIHLDNMTQSLFFTRACTQMYCEVYGEGCWCCWEIESCMKEITFEVWGGGGGGAGSCCCAWGPPGGAGAYAWKSITNYDGALNNCKYTFCVAPPSCCSPSRTCGYRGCRTFVLGQGLSNFCAEGGIPGCSLCFFFGCFPVSSSCGILWHPNRDTSCACYFGADWGVEGKAGGLEASCANTGNWCHYKTIYTLPPMSGYKHGSFKAVGAHCNLVASCDRCRVGSFLDGAHGGGSEMTAVGIGGTTARVCGGGCCCGWSGGPGMIKVSYKE